MQTTETALVILAGGLGSRFGGAKQIQPFGAEGHFLFEYACYDAMQAGFKKVFVIVKSGMEPVVQAQLAKWMSADRFEILTQEQTRSKPWGTAHALHFLYGKWSGSFLVLNADDYYGPQICQRAFQLAQDGVAAAALVYELGPTLSPNGPVARGLCQIHDDYLSSIEEVLKIQYKDGHIIDEQNRIWAPDHLISMNAWLLSGSFLSLLSERVKAFLEDNSDHETIEIYLPKVLNEMIAGHQLRIKVAAMPVNWFGITYAADLDVAQQKIAALEGQHYPIQFPTWI